MRKRIISLLIVLASIFSVSSCESFFDREATYKFSIVCRTYLEDPDKELPPIETYLRSVVDFETPIIYTDKKSVAMNKATTVFRQEVAKVDGSKILEMISGDEVIELSLFMDGSDGFVVVDFIGWSHAYNNALTE